MFPTLDPLPLAIAFAANFLVGGIWYALFANPWMREVGLDRDTIKTGRWPMPAYAIAAIGAAIQAVVFAFIVGWARPSGLGETLLLGACIGLLAAFATGKHHAFARKSWLLFAIDGGNDFVGFVAMGLVWGLAT
jgi:hypothetical protein